jgi:hypothetical protein
MAEAPESRTQPAGSAPAAPILKTGRATGPHSLPLGMLPIYYTQNGLRISQILQHHIRTRRAQRVDVKPARRDRE